FEHRSPWGQVVRKGVVDEIAGAEPRCEKRPREAPVVRRATLRFIERARRCEDEPRSSRVRPPPARSEAAERPARFLKPEQLGLAQNRQARQRRARGYCGGIHSGKKAAIGSTIRLRVRELRAQGGELGSLARFWIARLQG